MLRILLDDVEAHRVVLILHGHILEELPGALERGCVELLRSGLAVVLILSGFASIGRSGVEALGRLARAGVGVIGGSPLTADAPEQEGAGMGESLGDPDGGNVPGREGGATDPSG